MDNCRRRPTYQHRKHAGASTEPTVAELVHVLRSAIFFAGRRPSWDDRVQARSAIRKLFDRNGRFDPEAAEFITGLLNDVFDAREATAEVRPDRSHRTGVPR